MPSPEASRRNSLKSTGPRTPEGKAAVRLNSLSHGAFAADLLLPGEDAKAFRALEARFRAEYKPSSTREEFLVNRMILASWRLLRLAGLEIRVLRAQADRVVSNSDFAKSLAAFLLGRDDEPEPSPDPPPPSDPIARAWILDAEGGNTLLKLCRYQNLLERSFYRALHNLQRLPSDANQ